MNARDLAQIRRRLNADKRCPTRLLGCYMQDNGEILTTFEEDIYRLTDTEWAQYSALFKKVLTGTVGQQLHELEFAAARVMEGEEHQLLRALKEGELKDAEAPEAFFQKVSETIAEESRQAAQSVTEKQAAPNYLVLLLHDTWDVPYKDRLGDTDEDRSTQVMQYVLCCVCPVKQQKTALCFAPGDGAFRALEGAYAVEKPTYGFMYPAFADGGADLYRALYYTSGMETMHDAFVKAIFGQEDMIPAAVQSESFNEVLREALEEECSLDVVKAMHESVSTMLEDRKADKNAEPLKLGRSAVRQMLTDCGVSRERADAFEEKYGETFGDYAELPAVNLITPKQFKVEMPSVSIKVDPTRADLLETRQIDGKYYLLVPVDGDVEVNGVSVKL